MGKLELFIDPTEISIASGYSKAVVLGNFGGIELEISTLY